MRANPATAPLHERAGLLRLLLSDENNLAGRLIGEVFKGNDQVT